MWRFLTAWLGTRREIAEKFHQYELDLGEARMVIAGLRRVIKADEAALGDALDELREAQARIAQLELELEPGAPAR